MSESKRTCEVPVELIQEWLRDIGDAPFHEGLVEKLRACLPQPRATTFHAKVVKETLEQVFSGRTNLIETCSLGTTNPKLQLVKVTIEEVL